MAAATSPSPGNDGALFAFPASYAQERIWFFDRLHPRSALYNSPMAFRLTGSLHVDALVRSLESLVARHDALRTTFRMRNGAVQQVVHPALPPRIAWLDLRGGAKTEREAEAWRRATELAREPFDLERDAPLRALLVRLAEHEHLLVVVVHHIAADGWSVRILFDELSALYASAAAGREAELPAVAVQYPDYAVWQREWLDGGAADVQLDYWRSTLAGAPDGLELPSDRPRPAEPSYRGGALPLHVPAAVTRDLARLAAEEGASLFMALLAALDVLLHRLTGEARIAVGAPIAGRGRPELERTVGFFANTVVYDVDCSGGPSFRELLRRVRRTAADVFEHQDVPFQRVVEAVRPTRDAARTPLFQVMLALQPALEGALAMPGVSLQPLPIAAGTAKFELQLELQETGDGLRGVVEYASDLFDHESAARLAARYRVLLAGIAAAPDAPITTLPLLDAAERRLVVEEWNATTAPYPRDATVPALVAARADAAPHAVAIEDVDGSRASYGAVVARARALAGRLRAVGVRRGDVVAIVSERSTDLVVAMLGALEAGAIYLPIDPAHPEARIALMLEDARARALLAPAAVMHRLRFEGARLPLREATAPSADSAPREPSHAAATDPAYVMYTSGSTGRPKGVVVPHRAIARLVMGTDYVTIGPEQVVAHLSNPAFDAATFEIWGALLNGARLAVIARDAAMSPDSLARELAERSVSTLFLTTALFDRVAAVRPDAFATVDTLIVGGEALDPHSAARVLRSAPPRRLVNGYGPTETTTFAVTHEICTVPPGAARIPIGRPIANTRAYVLDAAGQPAGVGVTGELCIGGDGVALGYLERPALTAERFGSDPFAGDAGGRLYRTGDLARWLPDGTLDCLGRKDRQVKLRGYRIELGEIEAALREEPGVRDALAVVHGTDAAHRRVVAYVVGERDLDRAQIRARLGRVLPEYMVPSAMVEVPSIPLTANGKVDRAALPPPDGPEHAPGLGGAVKPRGTIELQLALMWQSVLGCGPVGVHDDFFELGGHSLLAAALLDEVRGVFGRELPLVTLFRAPTVSRLAQVLQGEGEEGEGEGDTSALVPLRPHGARPPFVLVHRTGGHLLAYRSLVLCLSADQPVYGLQAPGHERREARFGCVEEMAAHYVEALRRLDPAGPYHLGGSSFGGIVAFEMARQLEASGARVALLALLDTFPTNNLTARARMGRWRWAVRSATQARGRARRFLAMSHEERRAALRRLGERARGREPDSASEIPEAEGASRAQPNPVVAASHRAIAAYRMRRYGGAAVLFRAREEIPRSPALPLDLGWSRWVGRVEVVTVPGSHLSMLEPPHVAETAAALEARLARARASGG